MAQGRSAFKANGARSASRLFASTTGSARWLSRRGRGRGRARACRPAGRRPPAARRRRRGRAARRRQRIAAESAVADHAMRPGARQVQHRRRDDVESRRGGAASADQGAGEHRPRATRPPGHGHAANRSRRRADAPASAAAAAGRPGRLPGRPSAPPRRAAPRRNSPISARKLRRIDDVAGEQDDAGRTVPAQQRRLLRQQRRAGNADDCRRHGEVRSERSV